MDHFDKLISTELNELGIADKALLRAIDKLIKLNNAVLDSYFDSKFKDLKVDVEAQISASTARYIQALQEKDKVIQDLTVQVQALQDSNNILEAKLSSSIADFSKRLDDQDMYERRDTLVFSGKDLPPEADEEDAVTTVVSAVRNSLGLELHPCEINVAHRLGPKKDGKQRPIICKFVRRSMKSIVTHKCVTKKTKLYVNEHLTPIRRQIYSKLFKMKKETDLITQLHTKNGIFFLRLKNIAQRFTFTDEKSLLNMLNLNHPYLLSLYNKNPSINT